MRTQARILDDVVNGGMDVPSNEEARLMLDRERERIVEEHDVAYPRAESAMPGQLEQFRTELKRLMGQS